MIHPSIHSSMSNHSRFFPFLTDPCQLFPPRRLSTQYSSFDTLKINTSFPFSPVSSTVNPVIKFLLTFSSIHSSMFNHSRFFPFLTNTYRSFPLSTQCSSFDILTINTGLSSSPVSSSFLQLPPPSTLSSNSY